MSDDLITLAEQLGRQLLNAGHMLSLAESCTGGWIAQSVTEIAGSSGWFDRGFVTYSNAAKIDMLGVSAATLEKHGAVSAETASEMAAGALSASGSDVVLAVTGIAGPSGGTLEKPVGLVYIAWQFRGGKIHFLECRFVGDRHEVRRQTVRQAFACLLSGYQTARD